VATLFPNEAALVEAGNHRGAVERTDFGWHEGEPRRRAELGRNYGLILVGIISAAKMIGRVNETTTKPLHLENKKRPPVTEKPCKSLK
jgi:hypothetical protein